jgi:hypothetical protein
MKYATTLIMCLVLVGGLAGQGSEAAAGRGVGLRMAVDQPDLPIKLVRTENSLSSGPFVNVDVENVAHVSVTSIQFGAFVHHSDNGGQPRILTGPVLSAELAPGRTARLVPRIMTLSELEVIAAAYPAGAVVELGVLSVGLSDGTTLTFPAAARGRFQLAPVQVHGRTEVPCSGGDYPALGSGDYLFAWTCEDLSASIYCTNLGDSCIENQCKNPEQCPEQECKFKAA